METGRVDWTWEEDGINVCKPFIAEENRKAQSVLLDV